MTYSSLKNHLLSTGVFEDNRYLDLYVELIVSNRYTQSVRGKTQIHHIIPVAYYKYFLNNEVDNTSKNKVVLLQKDHVLAHYYLAFAFNVDILRYSSHCAVTFIIGAAPEMNLEQFVQQLDGYQSFYEQSRLLASSYNCMNDPEVQKRHSDKMKSDDVKSRIGRTVSKIRAATSDYVLIHCGSVGKRVPPEDVEFYLSQGWLIGSKHQGAKHLHKDNKRVCAFTEEEVQKLIAEGWILGDPPISTEHVQSLARSHYKSVYCVDTSGQLVAQFCCVKDAAEWWYNNGYGVERKKPTVSYRLCDAIKYSSAHNKYIEGFKWFYGNYHV